MPETTELDPEATASADPPDPPADPTPKRRRRKVAANGTSAAIEGVAQAVTVAEAVSESPTSLAKSTALIHVEPRELTDLLFKRSETFLELPEKLPYDDWATLVPQFNRASRCMLWWVGDFVLYGSLHYGEQHSQVLDELGYSESTVHQAAWLAEKIPPEERVAALSYKHHLLVGKMSTRERKHWLKRAVDEKLSVSELKAQIRKATEKKKAAAGEGEEAESTPPAGKAVITAGFLAELVEVDDDFNDALAAAGSALKLGNDYDATALRAAATKMAQHLAALLEALPD